MTIPRYIGAKDTIKSDLITIIDADEVLGAFTTYPSEALVNLTPEDTDLDPPTPLPFNTLQLGKSEDGDLEHSGGFYRNLKVRCVFRTWISPTERDETLPSLEELGECADSAFKTAIDSNTYDYIIEYKFLSSYPGQFALPSANGLKTLAYTVTTEFMLHYTTEGY